MNHRQLTEEDRTRLRSIGYNREGYATSTRRTVKDNRGSNQIEHFNGRVDAEIRPRPVKLTTRRQGDK